MPILIPPAWAEVQKTHTMARTDAEKQQFLPVHRKVSSSSNVIPVESSEIRNPLPTNRILPSSPNRPTPLFGLNRFVPLFYRPTAPPEIKEESGG